MRTLNTNVKPKKKYSRFSIPGFRSGSIIKKFIAVFYYCLIVVFMCSVTVTFSKGDFEGTKDILILIGVELCMLGVLLSPVVVIGFSEYYELNGIKQFLFIMVPVCILWTTGQWMCSLFSMQYIQSVNPAEIPISETADPGASSSSEPTIEEGVVKEALEQEAEASSAAE